MYRTNNWGIGLHDERMEPFWATGTLNMNRSLVHTSHPQPVARAERHVGPNQGMSLDEDFERAEELSVDNYVTLDFHHGAGQQTDSPVLSGVYDHEPPHATEGGYWIHHGDVKSSMDAMIRWLRTVPRLKLVGYLNEAALVDWIVPTQEPHIARFAGQLRQSYPDVKFVVGSGGNGQTRNPWTEVCNAYSDIYPLHILATTPGAARTICRRVLALTDLPIFVEELSAADYRQTGAVIDAITDELGSRCVGLGGFLGDRVNFPLRNQARWNYRNRPTFLLYDNHGRTPVGQAWEERYASDPVDPPIDPPPIDPPPPDPGDGTISQHAAWIKNKSERRAGKTWREGEAAEVVRRCDEIIRLDSGG